MNNPVNIQYILRDIEARFSSEESYLNLNLFSTTSAYILSLVLHFYGGKLNNGYPNIFINIRNEVIIYYKEPWDLPDFSGREPLLQVTKNKLKFGLKSFWKNILSRYDSNDLRIDCSGIGDLYISSMIHDESGDYILMNESEYKCLLDFLNDKDSEYLMKKYGKEIYQKMIGFPNENQFIIASLEMIEKEVNVLMKEQQQHKIAIMQELIDKKKELDSIYNEKIKELESQTDKKLAEYCEQSYNLRKEAC